MGPRVLVVDNYDSFVYNLVQELGELGAEPVVFRNDAIDVGGIRAELTQLLDQVVDEGVVVVDDHHPGTHGVPMVPKRQCL